MTLLGVTVAEAYWGILLSLFLIGGFGAFVCWIIWLRFSYHSQRRNEAFQEAALAHVKETADRTLHLTVKLDEVKEVKRQVQAMSEHMKEALPLPPAPEIPPTPSETHSKDISGLSIWPFATAVVMAATSITGANIIMTPTPTSQKNNTVDDMALKTSEGVALYEQGMDFMRRQDYVAACSLFTKARYMGPDLYDATAKAAECYLYLGQHDNALNLCNELISQVPKCGRAYLIRGLVYEAKGDKDTALKCWYDAASYGDEDAILKVQRYKRKV